MAAAKALLSPNITHFLIKNSKHVAGGLSVGSRHTLQFLSLFEHTRWRSKKTQPGNERKLEIAMVAAAF